MTSSLTQARGGSVATNRIALPRSSACSMRARSSGDDGALGGVVAGPRERARVAARPGGDVDHQAGLALAHRRQHGVAAIEHSRQVDGDDLVPGLDRYVAEIAFRSVDAGAVDEDIDALMAPQ